MQPQLNLKPLSLISQCKVCQGKATLFGVTDFNTVCLSGHANRYVFPLTGVPVYYHRCESCGLVYTEAMDDWSISDFSQHIYNEDYGQFDPEYQTIRPQQNSALILQLFDRFRHEKMLDYGGGTGNMARLMQAEGVDMVAWDPFAGGDYPDKNGYSFITSFEVFEHTPSPHETLAEISGFLQKGGIFFFSTRINDEVIAQGMNDFYIAPRNGHITIHSRASLQQLFSQHGFELTSLNQAYHMAMKMVD